MFIGIVTHDNVLGLGVLLLGMGVNLSHTICPAENFNIPERVSKFNYQHSCVRIQV